MSDTLKLMRCEHAVSGACRNNECEHWNVHTGKFSCVPSVCRHGITLTSAVCIEIGAENQASDGLTPGRVCRHGHLARSCAICELEDELKDVTAELAAVTAERDAAFAQLDQMRTLPDFEEPDQDGENIFSSVESLVCNLTAERDGLHDQADAWVTVMGCCCDLGHNCGRANETGIMGVCRFIREAVEQRAALRTALGEAVKTARFMAEWNTYGNAFNDRQSAQNWRARADRWQAAVDGNVTNQTSSEAR